MKNTFKILLAPLLCVAINPAVQGAQYALGAGAGANGLGASFSSKSNWSFIKNDQIQWHMAMSGMSIGDVEDTKLDRNEYETDIQKSLFQAGINWYPSTAQYFNRVFISAGLSYFDYEIKGTTQADQTLKIGGVTLSKDDETQLKTKLQQSSLAPYIGIGWGNKLSAVQGLSFRAEIGLLAASPNNADVTVTMVNGSQQVTDADLAQEKRNVKDNQGHVMMFGQVDLTYHF